MTDGSLQSTELVILQGNSFCNLNCTYCDLTEASRKSKNVMSMEVVTSFFADIFSNDLVDDELVIVWHSGEPLTLSPSYYEQAIALITSLRNQYAPEKLIKFVIQTNAVLIDEKWCDFFCKNKEHLDIGVSCDGPADLHDRYRTNWNCHSTHTQTVRGMDLLANAAIDYKIIAVVTNATLKQPNEFFNFFLERSDQLSGFHFNVLAESDVPIGSLGYTSNDRDKYYEFYECLLKLSKNSDLPIQNFSNVLSNIKNSNANESEPSGYFGDAARPIKSLSVEYDGEVTTFFAGLSSDVYPDLYNDGKGFSLGNILETSLGAMLASLKFDRMRASFEESARACSENCDYFSICQGGYEITKLREHKRFDAAETTECLIQVMTLADAVLDDLDEFVSNAKDADQTYLPH